jgi:hypothetical protein
VPKRRTDIASKRLRKTAKDVTATPAAPRVNGTPPKPASLDGRAAEIWDEFAPELVAIGMLTSRDVLMFALWCQLGAKVESGELSAALVTQFRLLGNDFGQSPSGKGRELSANPPAAKPSKFFKD